MQCLQHLVKQQDMDVFLLSQHLLWDLSLLKPLPIFYMAYSSCNPSCSVISQSPSSGSGLVSAFANIAAH